ncbi:MAG: TrkH family potassium uptake protein [Candidatus Edwardsbacteria bacterium]|nr:TrkH family potassium uptake protein [Candidatus Edwardsbacteria bacterium]MBU1576973.1 TrkH family potassium uptake protein [Candidatus Edwardsbacteria bacterium]MBU2462927.1 TrkH family potassium uptake protein [Candidatus Edwardsbacteria bacterium]MBU2594632.1 TrkH family potassium uptake protein [Candidatus Edwardsbacteria bacterium]
MKLERKIYNQIFRVEMTPARILVLGFSVAILLGSVLLYLPFSTTAGHRCTFVDALYTSTSAVCVTGLIVKDTAKDFTPAGKLIILLLIQIGGLGYMSLATVLSLMVGRKISLRERLIIQEAYNILTLEGLARFATRILRVTIVLEGLGALILSFHWWKAGFPISKAVVLGIFHSVSAFCNAGFSLFSNGLADYAADPVVSLTISGLVVSGGLGFIAISDIYKTGIRRTEKRLTTHSKLVVMMTLSLIITGTVLIYLLERNNTLAHLSPAAQWLAALFQSIAPRTAGFNTVNIGLMHFPTLMLIIILMFIGASPGGTGGGIKTTTFGVMMASIWTTLTGRSRVLIFKKRLEHEFINRAFVLSAIAAMMLVLVTLLLLQSEIAHFTAERMMPVLFEVVSAFGTVGLSIGSAINPLLSFSHDFSNWGKLLIILTMFAGRLGPLTMGSAVVWHRKDQPFEYPEAKVLIG